MATLHMDTDGARGVQSNMVNTHGNLTSTVSTMTSAVQGMVGSTWIGASATEFMAEYDNWRNTMNQLLDALNQLNTRLQTEIAEWESMSSKLA